LSIHSKEIQDFDYNAPRCHNIYGCMKELLNILQSFQINQGLIDEEDYYSRLSDQIARSRTMNTLCHLPP
jgi:hypothetical protein